ncbi:MAG: hypothetical protein ACJAXH_003654, partial [Colwellia sp.]
SLSNSVAKLKFEKVAKPSANLSFSLELGRLKL